MSALVPPDPSAGAGNRDSLVAFVRDRTPARVLAGRCGASYRTSTQLDLRSDHAAAVVPQGPGGEESAESTTDDHNLRPRVLIVHRAHPPKQAY